MNRVAMLIHRFRLPAVKPEEIVLLRAELNPATKVGCYSHYNMSNMLGEELPAGAFVMICAITAMVQLNKDDYFCVRYQGLGTIRVKFV
jgi:hypothetical protein